MNPSPPTSSRLGPLRRAGARLLVVGVVATAGVALAVAPAQAATVPAEGISLYVTNKTPSQGYTLGCELGTRDLGRAGTQTPLVALSFGGMVHFSNGKWGASLWGGADATTDEILAYAKEYSHGYWACTGSDLASYVEVALTTNNSLNTSTAGGTAWGQLVNAFGAYLGGVSYGSQVHAAGGNDIEPGFGNPGPARNWVAGYTATPYLYRLLNTGSADGCPTSHIPSSTECGTSSYPSWGPEDIYYVSWGAAPAFPVPEIYTPSGSMAQQWYWLTRYGVQAHSAKMLHAASASQQRACSNRSCSGTNNTVSTAYNQLYNALNQSTLTAQTPPKATDFSWAEDEL